MKLPSFLINNKEKFNKLTNFFTNITEELSLIAWVVVVFLLILYSYVSSEYNLQKITEIESYEQISSSIEIKEFSLKKLNL